MHIALLIFIAIIILFIGLAQSDNTETFSKICYSIFALSLIWFCAAFSLERREEKFIKKTPIHFQDKIAFITYEDKLVNCSEHFKMQFNSGDSVYVYKKQDDVSLGVKFEGGEFIYKIFDK